MKQDRVILDLRGLVIQCLYQANPTDTLPNAQGKQVPSAAHTVRAFIDRYLHRILLDYAPIQVIAVMEGGNVRRRTYYQNYKEKPAQDADDTVLIAERDKAFLAIQNLLVGLGCLLTVCPTVEADDMVAYLCERLPGKKDVYTVDADLLQLNSKETLVYMKGEPVETYRGIDLYANPRLVALYKSIVGDPNDGYLGVRGIGQAGWNHLISAFGFSNMEALADAVDKADYSDLEEFLKTDSDKIMAKLYASRDEWKQSWELAKLHPEWCELNWGGKVIRPQWKKRVPTIERVTAVLEPLGLSVYIPRFKKFCITRTGVHGGSGLNLPQVFESIASSPAVPWDYESYDSLKHPAYQEAKAGYVDVLSQRVTGCSFGFGDNLQHSIYLSLNHRDTANLVPTVLTKLLHYLDEREVPMVAQNATFEEVLTQTNFGIRFKKQILDTRVMANYVDENGPSGLKEMSKRYLNYDQIQYFDVVPPGGDMRDLSLDEVLVYGCDDSICTGHLYVLFSTIMHCEKTWDFYEQNEPSFDRVMNQSFITGVPIDYDRLSQLEADDLELKEKTEVELRRLLEKHCSLINEEGFRTLWGEVEPYERGRAMERALKKYKALSAIPKQALEDIEDDLEDRKERLRSSCSYSPLSALRLSFKSKKNISQVAKSLKLPGLRSMGLAWVNKYAVGIALQAEEQNVELSKNQEEFLSLLRGAAPFAKMASISAEYAALEEFCQLCVSQDRELWTGNELNIDSPKQMAELFYGMLGLPILIRNLDKTDDNQRTQWELPQAPSTSMLAIDTWKAEINDKENWQYQVLDAVATLRKVSTRFKLYYRPYPLFRSPADGRIHPNVKNFGTKTGRPSGSSPNPFQLTKRDDGKIRSMVLPLSEDELVVSIDFVQQELVILAGESNDVNLRACYQGNNKKDVHSLTATGILNVERSRQGKTAVSYSKYLEMLGAQDGDAIRIRKKPAKETNFLMAYQGSVAGLARKSVIPKDIAQLWYDSFFETYPGVKVYQERETRHAEKHGYVLSCFGTRKHCDGIFSKNKAIAASWSRQAGNFRIQGGAAAVLKKVMRKLVDTDLIAQTKATVYAPVYDELVSSVPKVSVVEYCDRMADCMEMELPGLGIGLETSVSLGRNWGEQIEVGTRPSRERLEMVIRMLSAGKSKKEIEAAVGKV